MSLALTDTVSSLKSKIQDETLMPPAKQKISYEVNLTNIFTLYWFLPLSLFLKGMFFKDSNTMAFYNLLSGATVHLQVKERGGRKK